MEVYMDEKIVASWVECQIIKKTIEALAAAGWVPVKPYTAESAYQKIIRGEYEYDGNESEFYRVIKGGKPGWVRFILGNGEDVLSDYTTNIDPTIEELIIELFPDR